MRFSTFRFLPLLVMVGHIAVCVIAYRSYRAASSYGIGVVRAYQCDLAFKKACRSDTKLAKELREEGMVLLMADSIDWDQSELAKSLRPYFRDVVQMKMVQFVGSLGRVTTICTNHRGSVVLYPDGDYLYTYETSRSTQCP